MSPLRFILGGEARTYFPQSSNSDGKPTYKDNNNNVGQVSHLGDSLGDSEVRQEREEGINGVLRMKLFYSKHELCPLRISQNGYTA